MWRFHLESQKSPNEVKMASGCEWEWVAKCNDKLHTECFFRLFKEKKKGLQVTDLQCLRRNTELPEHRGAAVLSSSALSASESRVPTQRREGQRGAQALLCSPVWMASPVWSEWAPLAAGAGPCPAWVCCCVCERVRASVASRGWQPKIIQWLHKCWLTLDTPRPV